MAAVDIDEHLGARLPLDLRFTDENGRAVSLGDWFADGLRDGEAARPPSAGGKPVVLVLAYFRCPMLCDLVLRGVADGLARQPLALGRDYRAITVSIDPRDAAPAAARKRRAVLQAMNLADERADWSFLVGDEPAIASLADRLGFRYAYDPKSDQYAHPAVAVVLTPDGRIARYLYGVTFRPLDLRLALDEASRGKTGGIVDRLLLTCFRYDPTARRYGWVVRGLLRAGATLTLLFVVGVILLQRRRRRA